MRPAPLRDNLVEYGLSVLEPTRRFRDSTGLTFLPGRPSKWGKRSDGLEGFTRPLLLSALLARHGDLPDVEGDLAYAVNSIQAGLSGRRPVWPPPQLNSQPVVEAAGLSLSLLIWPEIWQGLDSESQERLVRWMETAAAGEYANNWVLFPFTIRSWMASVGLEAPDSALDLRRITPWRTRGGWYSDGLNKKYDYYNSWAFHFYPPLVKLLTADDEWLDEYKQELGQFVSSFYACFDPARAHILWGRSLTYGSAATAALWIAALLRAGPVGAGELRDAAMRNIFRLSARREGELLDHRWEREEGHHVQRYSGPASPYWLAKAFVGLLAEPQDPLWTTEVVARTDNRQNLPGPPGCLIAPASPHRLVSAGISQYGAEIPLIPDPLYSRWSYSSATSPTRDIWGGDNSTTIQLPHGRRRYVRGRVSAVHGESDIIRATVDYVGPRSWRSLRRLQRGRLNILGSRVRFLPTGKHEVAVLSWRDIDLWIDLVRGLPVGTRFTRSSWAVSKGGRVSLFTSLNRVAATVEAPAQRDGGSERLGEGLRVEGVSLGGFTSTSLISSQALVHGRPSTYFELTGATTGPSTLFVSAFRLSSSTTPPADLSDHAFVCRTDTDDLVLSIGGRIIRIPRRGGADSLGSVHIDSTTQRQ
ncbi:DUF2264 domain-containing protein [Klenkia sesuvii]|uniref:DUF2264 domain-containing protein n=1 Tax=Klenkia sesuvii TaxID=3103137 RepID=UPI003D786D55